MIPKNILQRPHDLIPDLLWEQTEEGFVGVIPRMLTPIEKYYLNTIHGIQEIEYDEYTDYTSIYHDGIINIMDSPHKMKINDMEWEETMDGWYGTVNRELTTVEKFYFKDSSIDYHEGVTTIYIQNPNDHRILDTLIASLFVLWLWALFN